MLSASVPRHSATVGPGIGNKTRVDFLWTLPFLLLFWLQLYHHQMWRDELNVWGIVQASPTLSALAHYLHYEGHPGLWYYLLWFPSRFFIYPSAMKWVQAGVGTGIYLIIGLGSPWSRLEKTLVFLSYYICFEYTVLSRTYGLCVLAAFAYVYMRTKRPQAVAVCALLLGLMANTDMIGVILSGSLLIEYTWHLYISARVAGQPGRLKFIYLYGIYVGLVVVSYLTLRPAKDISWDTSGRVFSHAKDLDHLQQSLLSNLGLPWFPRSAQFPRHFWNPNVTLHAGFFMFVSVISTASIYLVFRRHGSLLALMALVVGGSILFSHLVYLGYMRQFGVISMAFLAAYWMMRSTDSRPSKIAIVLLIVSAGGSAQAIAGSWLHPFSNSGNAAKWIRAHHLEDEPLAGFPDVFAISIAEQIHRKMYFYHCRCSETFKLFSNRHDDPEDLQFTKYLSYADSDLKTDHYLLVLSAPLTTGQSQDLQAGHHMVTEAAAFTGAEEKSENFYLYQVIQSPPSANAQ